MDKTWTKHTHTNSYRYTVIKSTYLILGDVEETVMTIEIEETYEEIYKSTREYSDALCPRKWGCDGHPSFESQLKLEIPPVWDLKTADPYVFRWRRLQRRGFAESIRKHRGAATLLKSFHSDNSAASASLFVLFVCCFLQSF